MADFTPTQGRYLAFIHAYTNLHGYPPAESEIAAAMCVSPPSVNQMVKMLEKKGLILRQPGQPRSLQILVPEDEIPPWNNRKPAKSPTRPGNRASALPRPRRRPPANLYVVSVFLTSGPISEKFANKEISRAIEIRGDQTLEQLHHAIFKAYRPLGRASVRVSVRQTSVRSRRTQLRRSRSAGRQERAWRRTHDHAGRPGSEAGSCLRLLVRLRRRLVSSGSGGADRASHPDRHLPARHQAGGQVSAAVRRRMTGRRHQLDDEQCSTGARSTVLPDDSAGAG